MLKLAAIALAYTAGVNAFSAEVRQNVRNNFGKDRMIALPISELTDSVYEILSDFGADDIGRQDGAMHFKLSPSAVDQLDIEGVSFSDLTEEFISAMEENLNSENFVCTDGVEECASRNINDFHSSYQEFDTIHARFQALADANPGLTDLSTLGLSHEGREQKLLLIGDQSKPLVYYFCTVHAREWIVPMYCTYMAETLLDASNAESQDLLSRFSFAITPIGNPDGYIYSMEVNNAWRKTRKPNPSNSRCPGTDGNRNWGRGWGGPGSSGNTCSDTYRGTAPFDNPEIDNIRAFVDANKNRIIHVTDVHSYGEYWLAPYGGFTELPPDKAKHDQVNAAVYDAILATTGLRFKTGPAANVLYVAAGVSQDYLYTDSGIVHTYLYEARGGGRSGIAGFQPPTSNIMPSNIEMYAGMVAALGVIEAQEIRGIVPEPISLPEENIPQEPTEETEVEESADATDLSPLVGAVVFLGMVVAVMGALLGFVVFKFQNQQSKKEEKATHYELH